MTAAFGYFFNPCSRQLFAVATNLPLHPSVSKPCHDLQFRVEQGERDVEPVDSWQVGLIVAVLIKGEYLVGTLRRLGELIQRHQLWGLPVAKANAEAVRTALLSEIKRRSH